MKKSSLALLNSLVVGLFGLLGGLGGYFFESGSWWWLGHALAGGLDLLAGAGLGLAVAMVLPFGGEKKLIIGTGAGIVAAGICLGLGGQLAWSLLGAGYWAM